MDQLWVQAEWIECIHPGWPPLKGWAAIRESWGAIFRNPLHVTVRVTDVSVRIAGEVAWVSCLEHVSVSGDAHLDTSCAHATNVFVRRQGRWQMVVHHASPVPIQAPTLWEPGPGSVH
jgi:ketosteroid isomerase-like protein